MDDQPPPQPPMGPAAMRVVAMPADTNPNGDIFGGWLMSQMDLAGATVAIVEAGERVVTVAVDGMTFDRPVHVGDVVSVYGTVLRRGRTSVRIRVEAWARPRTGTVSQRVTVGDFTYVAIDEDRRPTALRGPLKT